MKFSIAIRVLKLNKELINFVLCQMFVKMSDGILKEEKFDLQEFRHFYKMQNTVQFKVKLTDEE